MQACHVLCPMANGDICRGRGPSLPLAAPGLRMDSWFGSQVYYKGHWVNNKNGCMWGLKDASGSIEEGWSDGYLQKRTRDDFKDAKGVTMGGVEVR